MGAVLLGAAVLIALIFLLRGFVSSDPKALAKALRLAGALALVVLAVGLFVTERPAAGAFIASMAWGVFTGGHVWPGGWPHWRRGAAPAQGRSSSVRTSWLDMQLDLDTGEMRGTVLQGDYAGRRLDQLDPDALRALHAQTAGDDETRRLLEAYLDRTLGPDWNAAAHEAPSPEQAASGMTRAEALKVLGLQEGASEEDIRAAHRRLMLQNHPDRGGTDYLASKINEAKDFLLGN